ncbi:MAG: hypothetical protein NW203_00120 [Hyphomonadaceae bacterium]|nr:hypothetical protein [Hyphomonadaceae bacterium]
MKTHVLAFVLALALGGCVAPQTAPDVAPSPTAGPERPSPGDAAIEHAELASMRAFGVTFRALGQEPGWMLNLFADRIDFAYDYGNADISAPRPAPTRPAWSGEIYETQTSAGLLRIEIRHQPCRDAMSGEAFPARVTVFLNQRRFEGCGLSAVQPG